MGFSKAFPRRSDKSVYPNWQDVYLSSDEERLVDEAARATNIRLMEECLDDATKIMQSRSMKDFDTSRVRLAIAHFEKRASHPVFWKEEKAKEKFDAAAQHPPSSPPQR